MRDFPFGPASRVERYTCPPILAGGSFRAFLAAADTHVSFVQGDELLALVNRSPTGALPPTYVPSDLVDIRDGTARTASECDGARVCLRREAAAALHHMLDQMRIEGLRGLVQSAFRAFGTQCWVFAGWAHQARGGFCEATEQSALPGHSQHQLGTTVDMFTSDWGERGAVTGQGVFRSGFGCTAAGKWFDENAWRHGFVVPYPIDPEDRKDGSRCLARSDRAVPVNPKTGYKQEPWHLRFIGVEAAARYHEAWLASDPGTPQEITLEQWLRDQRGLVGDTELPVCDGCTCGACSTLAGDGEKAPCEDSSLRLGPDGKATPPSESPRLLDAHVSPTRDGATVVELRVRAPAHTPTQTPITNADGPTYDANTFEAVVPYADARPHGYGDLPGAWRVAVEPIPTEPIRWPWRGSLAKPELATVWNRANVLLPANPGEISVRIRVVIPPEILMLRAALLHDGEEYDVRTLPAR
jgi:LAS superfamily LD-carboxypeptidase LdcB